MESEPPSLIFTTLAFPELIWLGGILLLLFCSALISGAEIAFFSLSSTDLDPEEGVQRSKRMEIVARLLDSPKRLLATILIANNLINIAIVLVFDSVAAPFFKSIDPQWLKFLIEVGLVTFLILLFGEILPKVYASRNKVRFAMFMAFPIQVLFGLFTPLSRPMRNATVYLERKFSRQKLSISVDQLSQALELTSDEETTHDEQKILQGIVTFGATDTKNVMRPRIDIFALDIASSYTQVLEDILKHGYSRIPVYQESIDQIKGILYIKDLLPHFDKKDFAWSELLRAPYFVPENKKLDDLLNEFKQMKMHLAIVVDEYGGTSGLITLEDIIEEIVGEITDEFDDEDLVFSKLDDRNFIFEGKTPLKDFYRVIQLEDPNQFEESKGEAESLAGFILELTKGFPKKDEIVVFGRYHFVIESFQGKRINQIKLTIND
ncbi:MAG TPA: gliding motility-associated protein GldE [Flavobacteriaceae bacterium]|nr:gliding motility-associated protein GldE [Flavobacteriaceae bacterium]